MIHHSQIIYRKSEGPCEPTGEQSIMNLFMMALLLSLHVARKVTGDLTPSQKHCENVSGCKDFNILVQSASNLMNSITKEAAGKSTNMQVSVCIQSSMPSNSGTENTPSRGGTDVRPENEPIHSKATDCSSLQQSGITKNGVYKIWPKFLDHSINVYCDMENNGGGWTVIQRRGDFEPHINFYETWKKYREGFGDLNKEFWLGSDAIFALTNQEPSRLRVDLEDFEGNATHAEYGNFLIRSEVENYRMIIANYEGTAGDAMLHHNDADFSTKDKAVSECPVQYKGAWWYKACHLSNLNGLYLHGTHESYANGVNWKPFRGYHYSLKTTEMKIRPANR